MEDNTINELAVELAKEDHPKKEKSATEKRLKDLSLRISSLEKRFKTHINEPSATIMVKEKDETWGEWTGVFTLSDEEKIEKILVNVENHFNTYFKNEDKKLAMFTTIQGQKALYKELN